MFREHRICVFNILEFFGSGDKNADKGAMGSIASLSSGYLQSILSNVLQTTGLTGTTKNTQNSGALSSAQQMDNTQLSPFAQVTSELQQLQQSNPTEYRQVTQQIATNLQTAAQSATASGNMAAASQLNQLATDFQNASTRGQLPNFQDLAQAAGGHHHHHHHAASASTDSTASATSSSSSASQSLNQLMAGLQAGESQNDTLNPMTIILNTLSTAGIGGSSGA